MKKKYDWSKVDFTKSNKALMDELGCSLTTVIMARKQSGRPTKHLGGDARMVSYYTFEDVYKRVQELARANNTTVSSVIRTYLENYVATHEKGSAKGR